MPRQRSDSFCLDERTLSHKRQRWKVRVLNTLSPGHIFRIVTQEPSLPRDHYRVWYTLYSLRRVKEHTRATPWHSMTQQSHLHSAIAHMKLLEQLSPHDHRQDMIIQRIWKHWAEWKKNRHTR